MSQTLAAGSLRGVAIAIAVVALFDPVLTVERVPAIPTDADQHDDRRRDAGRA